MNISKGQLRTGLALLILAGIVVVIFQCYKQHDNEKPDVVSKPIDNNAKQIDKPGVPVALAAIPLPSEVEKGSTSPTVPLLYRVVWDNNAEPVSGAFASLSLDKIKPFNPLDTIVINTVTDDCGIARFLIPKDYSESKKCASELVITHSDALPYKGDRQQIGYSVRYPEKTYTLRIKKNCGITGTVYWKPDGINYVPAPSADVIVVNAVVPSEQMNMAHLGLNNDFHIKTDADGRYRFRGLTFAPQQLWSRLGEYTLLKRPDPVMPEIGAPTKQWDIYLERGMAITAMVSDKSTFAPIRDASVNVRYGGGLFLQSANTDMDGYCELKGISTGAVLLEASAEGYARDTALMEISPTGKSHIPFYLGAGGTLRVLSKNTRGGEVLPNLNIEVYSGLGNFWISETTGDDGYVTISDVPCGTDLTVSASDDSLRGSARCKAKLEGTTTVTLHVLAGSSSHKSPKGMEEQTFEGIVVDSAGAPVPSATISTAGCCNRKVLTDAKGCFSVKLVHAKIIPCSEDSTDVTAFLDWEQRLGSNNKATKAYYDRFVRKVGLEGGDLSQPPCFVGPIKVHVEAYGYAPLSDVYIAANTINTITLPSSGNLKICVLDKDTRQPITDYYTKQSGGHRIRVVSGDGCYTFANIKPAEYLSISVSALGYISQFPDGMPSDETLNILLERQNYYNAVVLDGITQKPVGGVLVREANFMIPDTWSDYDLRYKNASYSAEYVTDANGAFTFTKINGQKSLLFVPPDGSVFSIQIENLVKQYDAKTELIIINITAPIASVNVRYVVGPDVFNEENASLWLSCVDQVTRVNPGGRKEVSSHEDGIWKWENLHPGEYRLMGSSKGIRGQDVMKFSLQQGEQKSLTLGQTCIYSIAGHFYKNDGTPYPNAHLKFYSVADSHWDKNVFDATAGDDGAYSAEFIAAGEYDVFLVQGPPSNPQYIKRLQGPCAVLGNCVIDFKIEEFSENKPPSSVEQ